MAKIYTREELLKMSPKERSSLITALEREVASKPKVKGKSTSDLRGKVGQIVSKIDSLKKIVDEPKFSLENILNVALTGPSTLEFQRLDKVSASNKITKLKEELAKHGYEYSSKEITNERTGEKKVKGTVVGTGDPKVSEYHYTGAGFPVDAPYNLLVNLGLGTQGERKGPIRDAAEGASQYRDMITQLILNEIGSAKQIFTDENVMPEGAARSRSLYKRML